MPIEKTPFRKYNLDDEPGDTFTIRLNKEERKALNTLRSIFDVNSDSKAMKLGALVGLNVLQHTFGYELVKYLFKKERVRMSDYHDISDKESTFCDTKDYQKRG